MVFTFQDFVFSLDRWGVSDVLLPFILVFAVVYAILLKIKFVEDKKGINVTIALVMALTVVIPHITNRYPAGMDVVDMINRVIPNIMLVGVAVLLFLLLVGIFKVEAANLADVGYSFISLVLVNIWTAAAYPEITTFILIVSALAIGITLVVGEGQAFFGRLPIIFGITIAMIFHYTIGWGSGLPSYLRFLNNSVFQTLVIGVLVFFFFMAFITREKPPEHPTEKAFKLFK